MAKRVFVGWTHSLFHRTVCLLLNDPGIQIVGGSQDLAAASGELDVLQPDIILLETSGGAAGCRALLDTIRLPTWQPQIICASLNDNVVWTWHQEQHLLDDGGDLLRLILDT